MTAPHSAISRTSACVSYEWYIIRTHGQCSATLPSSTCKVGIHPRFPSCIRLDEGKGCIRPWRQRYNWDDASGTLHEYHAKSPTWIGTLLRSEYALPVLRRTVHLFLISSFVVTVFESDTNRLVLERVLTPAASLIPGSCSGNAIYSKPDLNHLARNFVSRVSPSE